MHLSELERILDVARESAREAGWMLASGQQSGFEVSHKGRIDLVTDMDLRAERMLVKRIQHHFPEHGILAEEEGRQGGDGDVLWIIDPLDGTTNYAHGYRFFAVSIAVQVEGVTQVGVVHDPVVDECFSAIRGAGASLNGRRIGVSETSRLIDSMLATGFSYDRDRIAENLRLFCRATLSAQAVRRGSAALDLSYVACGRFDGFWEQDLCPWDVAAGLLLVEEAGGRVSNYAGDECSVESPDFLVTNGQIHEALRELLAAGG